MDLSLRSIKTNHWSADIFEKHVTSMIYTLKLAIQSGDTGQLLPFLTDANWCHYGCPLSSQTQTVYVFDP